MPPKDTESADSTQAANEVAMTGDQVRERELHKIRNRRKAQFGDSHQNDGRLEGPLVGLALSGGGVRSGAFCLGVLQALHKAGVLRYVDYLATVSGGGYAGAYLSSAVVSQKDKTNSADNSSEETDQKAFDEAMAKIAPEANGRQPRRMFDFIFAGSYLRQSWAFFNRYLIGLLLIWIVVFSGLIALASLTALLFRLLDKPESQHWLNALGFDGDLRRALFPSTVLLVLWACAWAVSYFKYSERASGGVARVLFRALFFITLVAIAIVLGNGDLSFSRSAEASGNAPKEATVNNFTKTIFTAVITSVIVGLVPYLSPRRLLRSGASPRNAAEKYTFWIATRALVFGIPFLVVAFFARENISGYNDTRTAALAYSSEIEGWRTATWTPFWRKIAGEQDPVAQSLWNECAVAIPEEIKAEVRNSEWAELKQSDLNGESMSVAFQVFAKLTERSQSYRANLSFPSSWWSLAEFTGEKVLKSKGANTEDIYQFVKTQRQIWDLRTEMVKALNTKLKDPEFYNSFTVEVIQGNSELSELKGRAEEISRSGRVVEPDQDEILDVNRQLLTAYSDDGVLHKGIVFAGVVLDADQRYRLKWFLWSAAVFVVSAMFINLNATSLHGFYSSRLAFMWIEPWHGENRDYPLRSLDTAESGGPYHLICGTVLFPGRFHRQFYQAKDHFLFSQMACGSDRLGYQATEHYANGETQLIDAIGISGGAMTPFQTSNPLVLALLILGNVRLGQWIRNPAIIEGKESAVTRIVHSWPMTPWRFLWNLSRIGEKRPFCFVSDGGLHENLGVDELLKRRCRLIIAVDVGQDERAEFTDFAKLERWARMKHGIGIFDVNIPGKSISLESLIPNAETGFAKSHFSIARIEYPEDHIPSGFLVYVKSSMTGDEPRELLQFRKQFSAFPHDPTADQFYSSAHFESYRLLGFHIVQELCKQLPQEDSARWNYRGYEAFVQEFVGAACKAANQGDSEVENANLSDSSVSESADILGLLDQLVRGSEADQEFAANRLRELGPKVFTEMDALLKSHVQTEKDKRLWSSLAIRELFHDHAVDAMPKLLDWLETKFKSSRATRLEALYIIQANHRSIQCEQVKMRTIKVLKAIANNRVESAHVRKRAARILNELGDFNTTTTLQGGSGTNGSHVIPPK